MSKGVSASALLIALIVCLFPSVIFGEATIAGAQSPAVQALIAEVAGGVDAPPDLSFPASTLPSSMQGNEAVQQLVNQYRNDPQMRGYFDAVETPGASPKLEMGKQKEEDKEKKYSPAMTVNDPPQKLPIFGQEIFKRAYPFAPPSNVPVSTDYVIGPDDSIVLMLSGRINERYNLVVSRDGSIYIPRLGVVQVAGLKFRELQALIRKKMEAIVGVEASITMGALRSISVFVLGAATRPGAYTVSSFDTLLNALIYAGGPEIAYPALRGSMRNIQLKRQDKTITTFDIYELMLEGDKTRDVRLQAGDIIFIPPPGALVSVVGEVRFPAIYELKKERDLKAVLALAGGLNPSAFGGQVQVQRYHENKERLVLDTSWEEIKKTDAPFLLQDGDEVIVFPITRRDSNSIHLFGNVFRPGRYAFFKEMRVSDLIKNIESLKPETHMDYALVVRQGVVNLPRSFVPFDLGKALSQRNSQHDILLFPGDEIYIFNIWSFKEKAEVTVKGEVRKPGSYKFGRGARIKDLLLMAGNITLNASIETGELLRVDKDKKFTSVYFNVQKALSADPKHNLPVENQDSIIIHSIWSLVEKKKVYIEGEVLNPGEYQYTENMTVSDLIFRAGNLRPSAYLYDAEITSFLTNEKMESYAISKVINLEKALANDSVHNINLIPKDRLIIRRIPG
ncbi:MAG: SLBB domain-containing protein [Deltaproteobacteria bacterium]|nr:SLBB domain-containing protein [Deltaproteobacteria bacterium]